MPSSEVYSDRNFTPKFWGRHPKAACKTKIRGQHRCKADDCPRKVVGQWQRLFRQFLYRVGDVLIVAQCLEMDSQACDGSEDAAEDAAIEGSGKFFVIVVPVG